MYKKKLLGGRKWGRQWGGVDGILVIVICVSLCGDFCVCFPSCTTTGDFLSKYPYTSSIYHSKTQKPHLTDNTLSSTPQLRQFVFPYPLGYYRLL